MNRKMRNVIIILLLAISLSTTAQNTKYPYKYRLSVTGTPSFYYFTYDTTNNITLDTTKFLIDLNIIDKEGKSDFANVKLVFDKGDTLDLTPDFPLDFIKKAVRFEDFKLYFKSFSQADINFNVCVADKISKITVIIGAGRDPLAIPILESSRPLSEKEIIEIIHDISNQTKDSKLLNNGTCHYSWEI